MDHAVGQLKAKAATMAAVEHRAAKKPAAKPAAARRNAKVANGGGFAFAMDEGSDERDADFHR
jgi:methyl-accepting chemotaxis protein